MLITKEMCIGLENEYLEAMEEGSNYYAMPEAKTAFLALCSRAKQDGFSLDIASSYRSFYRQVAIFSAKFDGLRPVLNKDEKVIDISSLSPFDKVKTICYFSAIPGFSRHHFGTDFDIYSKALLPKGQSLQLTAHEYAKGSYFYELGLYLQDVLGEYGFYLPYSGANNIGYEPWHISYRPLACKFIESFDVEYAKEYIKSKNYNFSDAVLSYMDKSHCYREMIALEA